MSTPRTNILAIDPGASGGFAWRVCGITQCVAMPETDTDVANKIIEIIELARDGGGDIEVIVEKVGGFAGEGQPGSAMFNFGFSAGLIDGVLIGQRARLIKVTPQKWQKPFNLGGRESVSVPKGIVLSKEQRREVSRQKAQAKAGWKRKLKQEAQRRYPNLKVTLKTADALLMLEYLIRYENGATALQSAVPKPEEKNTETDLMLEYDAEISKI